MIVIDEVRKQMYSVESKTGKKPFEIVMGDDLVESLKTEIKRYFPANSSEIDLFESTTDIKLFGLPVIASPYSGVLEVR